MKFELICSCEPGRTRTDKGDWNINIIPLIQSTINDKKIETWDRVFDIKQRYINDIKEFHEYWIQRVLKSKSSRFNDISDLRSFMHAESLNLRNVIQEKMEEKAHIKMILFEFMSACATDRFIDGYLQKHNNI